jgi:hypothetical protein
MGNRNQVENTTMKGFSAKGDRPYFVGGVTVSGMSRAQRRRQAAGRGAPPAAWRRRAALALAIACSLIAGGALASWKLPDRGPTIVRPPVLPRESARPTSPTVVRRSSLVPVDGSGARREELKAGRAVIEHRRKLEKERGEAPIPAMPKVDPRVGRGGAVR